MTDNRRVRELETLSTSEELVLRIMESAGVLDIMMLVILVKSGK